MNPYRASEPRSLPRYDWRRKLDSWGYRYPYRTAAVYVVVCSFLLWYGCR